MTTRTLTFAAVLAIAAALPPPVRGDDATRERAVTVALALAAARPDVTPVRTDELKARADATKANKPVVLVVGMDAAKVGKQAAEAGAVPVSVKEYASDERGSEPRIVVLEPQPGKKVFARAATLPPTASAAEVRSAVLAARPKKLDWTMP